MHSEIQGNLGLRHRKRSIIRKTGPYSQSYKFLTLLQVLGNCVLCKPLGFRFIYALKIINLSKRGVCYTHVSQYSILCLLYGFISYLTLLNVDVVPQHTSQIFIKSHRHENKHAHAHKHTKTRAHTHTHTHTPAKKLLFFFRALYWYCTQISSLWDLFFAFPELLFLCIFSLIYSQFIGMAYGPYHVTNSSFTLL